MIDSNTAKKIKTLSLEGQTYAEIGRILGISYPTIKKYITSELSENLLQVHSNDAEKVSKLIEPFQEKIEQYIHNQHISSSKKIERLLRHEGYVGSYPLLNTYIQKRRAHFISSKANSYLRVETAAGEQAQVDWGHFGSIVVNGIRLNLYVFVFCFVS